MPSRPPRRQGVVYGPPRPPDARGGGGSAVGRIAGLAVIILAVAVLAAGGVAILGGPRTLGPSATPTARPSIGSPPASPTSVVASASPPPSPAPSAEPTPFLPVVQVGPGFVTFGTRANADKTIEDPRAVFQLAETVTWSAFLSEPASAAEMLVRVLKLDPAASGGERLISEASLRPGDAGTLHFVRRIRPARVLDGPGVYVVRYVHAETVLAEGYFLIEG